MKNYKSILNETKDTLEFRSLIDVYEDIAAGKLRIIKEEIIMARDYYEGLRSLSVEVGSDFQSALEKSNPSEAALFIAANGAFYGDIIHKTFQLFLAHIKTRRSKNFVAGTLGTALMKQYAQNVAFTSIPLPNDKTPDVSGVLREVISFSKISVFYSKFRNIAVQEARENEVSGKMFPQKEEDLKILAKKRMRYLYEPAIYPVSEVFTKDILKGVLEQMISEAELSQAASRIMNLDQAIDRTDLLLKKLDEEKRRTKKRLFGKKQNEMVTRVMRQFYGTT